MAAFLASPTLADTTFGGIISGVGELIKAGSGSLILTGTNLYTGGTSPSAEVALCLLVQGEFNQFGRRLQRHRWAAPAR